MNKNHYSRYRLLKSHGWGVRDENIFNHGSETARHLVAKVLVAHYAVAELGSSVSFEVPHDERGEIDVVVWDESDCFCVELETSPTQEVIDDKIERYVTNSPLREVFVISVTDMPEDIMEAYKYVSERLP